MAHRSGIQSTAGAVPVRTEKGVTMEKVKVTRYIAGKIPEYAQKGSSTSESSGAESGRDEDDYYDNDNYQANNNKRSSSKHFQQQHQNQHGRSLKSSDFVKHESAPDAADFFGGDSQRRNKESAKIGDRPIESSRDALKDRRMRRLMQKEKSREGEHDGSDSEDDQPRRRHVVEPEVIEKQRGGRASGGSKRQEENEEAAEYYYEQTATSPSAATRNSRRRAESSDEAEEDELSEEEMQRRRALLRMKIAAKDKEELLAKAEESDDEEEFEDEETEYEESESDEDELHRLKPVFVKKKDRVTLADSEKEQQKQREKELRKKYEAEERKRQSAKLVEDLVKLEMEMERKKQDDEGAIDINSVLTDDENEELAYEAWKVRELKRIKRTKEEREQHEKEKAELDRIHSMTEDERRAYLRANPKVITNKQQKGKYKFLQKYYHRGVFYLDEDDEVYKRNFAEATLEDHFNRSVLPKIMQVKDFGKAGRTKWSHLVAEDTTDFQSAWNADTAQNVKFYQKHSAGIKDIFERPALKKRKKM